jgi:Holliday junction resolvase RusA-like endonuclease
METIRITLTGECPIKKNAMKKLWFRTDKKGNQIPLKFPIMYYPKPYEEWVKQNISHLAIFKVKNPDIKFPLTGKYFISFWWFRKRVARMDFDNLSQAPMDLLAGNGGNFLGKDYKHSWYQILADDNLDVVTCMPTSHLFYDPVKPRTEIFITSFDIEKFSNIHKYIYAIKDLDPAVLRMMEAGGEPTLDFLEDYK